MHAFRAEDDDIEGRVLVLVGIGDRGARHHVRRHARREPVDGRLRGDVPDRELAVAGARGRAVARVAVVARADDRRVADTAGVLVSPAARRDRRRHVPALVEREEVHGAALLAHGLANDRQELHATADARGRLADGAETLHPQLASRWRQVLRGLCADLPREPRGAFADDEDVWCALHNRARDRDRMEISRERGNCANAVAGPIDDRGVELDLAEHIGLPATADARVRRVGLDDLRARLDRVKR